MARKFLWLIAILTLLVVAAAIVWRLFAPELLRTAFTPASAFDAAAAPPAPDFAAKASWIARPDLPGNPALWAPPGYSPAPRPAAAVFFVNPTAWLDRSRWNAPLDDAATNDRLDRFTRMQATVFNGVAEVWVPRYRQATFGSFLQPGPDADRALALAYSDVLRAFDAFLAAQPADRPLILAGHSQGSRHILHLLRDRRAVLAGRLVAAYPVGWAVTEADLAAVGLPACTEAGQAGCLATWQSFAADGDLAEALDGFAQVRDISGTLIGTRPMLCLNPLSGGRAAATAERNAGMLVEDALQPRAVGAACDPRGLLLISPTPDPGPFVLPGGNFHVYDYGLFWANVRADVESRLSSFGAAKTGGQPLPAGVA
jgi:hypothetical protein